MRGKDAVIPVLLNRIQSHTEEARRADDILILWAAGRWLKFSEP